ncbi:MAG: hypothetical protein OXT73_09810 [Bacteroidota bacterium]|nr:hypothetical protein [Bacteroidota bacterium]
MIAALIVGLAFGSSLLFIKMILDYNRDKMLAQGNSRAQLNEGETLRVSELREMIQEAVTDAVAPLEARMDELEGLSLPEAPSRKALPQDTRPGTQDSEENDPAPEA